MPARDRATPDRLHGPGWSYTLPARAGRRRVDRPGLLRVASQDVTVLMSAHAPPPGPIRAREPSWRFARFARHGAGTARAEQGEHSDLE